MEWLLFTAGMLVGAFLVAILEQWWRPEAPPYYVTLETGTNGKTRWTIRLLDGTYMANETPRGFDGKIEARNHFVKFRDMIRYGKEI